MSRMYILDDQHQPVEVDVHEWARWRKEQDALGDPKRVALDTLEGVRVSTVFLGIDHGFSTDPKALPVLFETMVFVDNPAGLSEPVMVEFDQLCERYCTWDQAAAGHALVIQRLKLAMQPHGEAALRTGGMDALDALAQGDNDNGQ